MFMHHILVDKHIFRKAAYFFVGHHDAVSSSQGFETLGHHDAVSSSQGFETLCAWQVNGQGGMDRLKI